MKFPTVERGCYRWGTGGITVRKTGAAVPPIVPTAVQKQFHFRSSGTTVAAAVLPPDKKTAEQPVREKIIT